MLARCAFGAGTTLYMTDADLDTIDNLDAYRDFIALANAGAYRDALLRLEDVWMDDRSEFYAGLLQLMAACLQMETGRVSGPRYLLRRARERLSPHTPAYRGLDVAGILAFIRTCERLLPEADDTALPDEMPTLTLTTTTNCLYPSSISGSS